MDKKQLYNIKNLKQGYVKSLNLFYNHLFGNTNEKNIKLPKNFYKHPTRFNRKYIDARADLIVDSSNITEMLLLRYIGVTKRNLKKLPNIGITEIIKGSYKLNEEIEELADELSIKDIKTIAKRKKENRLYNLDNLRSVEYMLKSSKEEFLAFANLTYEINLNFIMDVYNKIHKPFFNYVNMKNWL